MEDNHRALFFTARLLPTVILFSVAFGEQVGVSLQLQGQTIPNNSLVDLADLLYHTRHSDDPTNSNGLQTLMCVTDLIDCCETPERGYWYHPDGSRVGYYSNQYGHLFESNRGQNEIINDQKFYGSVRIWRQYTPPQRGLFHCELPDANGATNILYANILYFSRVANSAYSVAISTFGSSTAGEMYSLNCLATLYPNHNPPLPDPDIPPPTYEWFYGPNGSASLPSGLSTPRTTFDGSTYTSRLDFSPLSQSHTGIYTCRLGAGNLVNSFMLTVTAPSSISAVTAANLTASLNVGQTGNSLTCEVSGAEKLSNLTIAYHWTRNQQAVSGGNFKTLNLSPLRLSDAGNYACNITVRSTLLWNGISASSRNNQSITIQIPDPQSVTLTNSDVVNGADVTINCTVEFVQALTESELSLLTVDVQLYMSRKGATDIMRNLSDSNPMISGTNIIYSTTVNSFSRSDSGNYSCMATIQPYPSLARPSSFYLHGTEKSVSNRIQVTTVLASLISGKPPLSLSLKDKQLLFMQNILDPGILFITHANVFFPQGTFFSSKGSYVNPNGNIVITDIGEGDCEALLCYTDLLECCQDGNTEIGVGTLGEWFYPNGSVVGTRRDRQEFYVDRGPSVVRLNRRSNATSTTGWFCCVVPDVTSTRTRICVNVHVAAPLPSKQAVTCTREAAIGAAVAVGAIIIIECLFIGAPITLVLLRILRQKIRLAARDLNEKESSNKEGAASDAAQRSRMKEDVYVEPNHDKTATAKPVIQDEEPYEVMNNYTMLQYDRLDDDNIYVVPDNTMMATTMRDRGVGEDTVNTAAGTITMWPGGGERESAVYEDPDNPGVDTYTSLRERSELN